MEQTPRPIGFLSTVNTKGERNLAPFSYFNMVSHDPPCVMAAFTHPLSLGRSFSSRSINGTDPHAPPTGALMSSRAHARTSSIPKSLSPTCESASALVEAHNFG